MQSQIITFQIHSLEEEKGKKVIQEKKAIPEVKRKGRIFMVLKCDKPDLQRTLPTVISWDSKTNHHLFIHVLEVEKEKKVIQEKKIIPATKKKGRLFERFCKMFNEQELYEESSICV